MLFTPLPIAWIEGLAPVVLLILWIVRQVITVMGEDKQRKAMEEARVAGDPNAPGAEGEPAPREDAVRAELENFLRELSGEPKPEPARVAEDDEEREQWQRVQQRRGQLDPFSEPAPAQARQQAGPARG